MSVGLFALQEEQGRALHHADMASMAANLKASAHKMYHSERVLQQIGVDQYSKILLNTAHLPSSVTSAEMNQSGCSGTA